MQERTETAEVYGEEEIEAVSLLRHHGIKGIRPVSSSGEQSVVFY